MTYVIQSSITNLTNPMFHVRIIGSIVGLMLLIWFGLFVVFLLVDSSTLPALLESFTDIHNPMHLIISFSAVYIVCTR
ncbi:hypothetical protein O4G76_20410, partial [Limimaricola sp. G21655-S1]|uniref:hypothetical protein n=1 Tax=Limimaricola sp. G21655-S1 TaxID=3014768 RepID=UPI0022B04373